LIFWPGKIRDGWFTADHLLDQVNHAINIFEEIMNGYAQVLFLFDNALAHLMVKGAFLFISQICYLTHSQVQIMDECTTTVVFACVVAPS
jgi:hypothetical protein